jgi:hypothetical protein
VRDMIISSEVLEKWPMTMKGWIYPGVGKVANDNERMDLS